ncbi:MAG: hypothetical protein ACT4PT_09345 [Methanobacteriota archaeon]
MTEDAKPPAPGPDDPQTTGAITVRIQGELELLRRHILMLKAVMDHEPIGIIKLAEVTGFQQHKVRYSLRVLEQEGLIEPSPNGAVTTKKLREFIPQLETFLASINDLVADLKSTLQK